MQAEELRDILKRKSITRQVVADMARVNIRTVFYWLDGSVTIPDGRAELLHLKTAMLPDVVLVADPAQDE